MTKPSASSAEPRLGAKPPSSPTLVLWPASFSSFFSDVEDLGAHAQRLGERSRADRHDHELLDVDRVVGMGAAVDDVHHRHRQHAGRRRRRHSGRAAGPAACAAALATARLTPRMALAPRRPLFGVPSRSISSASIAAWSSASMPDSASKISPLTASTALQHALAAVAALVAVAQLDRLVGAGGGARGHGGAAEGAVSRVDIDLDGRIAAAVENFARVDVGDHRHGKPRGGLLALS